MKGFTNFIVNTTSVHLQEQSSILYKADQRHVEQTGKARTFSTFLYNDEKYLVEKPFGSLLQLNDVFLSPGGEKFLQPSPHTQQFILPVVGALSVSINGSEDQAVYPEEVLCVNNSQLQFRNRTMIETVNYLHLILKSHVQQTEIEVSSLKLSSFDQMLLFTSENEDYIRGSIGVFKKNTAEKFVLNNPNNGAFVYVINGSFEVEHRFISHRDGLAFRKTKEINFKPVTEFSVLMIIEHPASNLS